MHRQSRDAFTAQAKADILAHLGIAAEELQDLGGFESFVFARPQAASILRITHESHRSAAQISAELGFVEYLADQGASVAKPRRSADGKREQVIGEFTVVEFDRAPGQLLVEADWQPGLFHHWGRMLGQLHRLSAAYAPDNSITASRLTWREDPNFAFDDYLPEEDERIRLLAATYRQALERLPVTEADYGLIHCDAHPGNFFINQVQHPPQLTLFDFDDCCYHWFGYDIATCLFSAVLQPWVDVSQAAKEAQARTFLPEFLAGYRTEFPVSPMTLGQLPLFLKLRELSLYCVIKSQFGAASLPAYPQRFMSRRRERLEAGLPFLALAGMDGE